MRSIIGGERVAEEENARERGKSFYDSTTAWEETNCLELAGMELSISILSRERSFFAPSA